MLLESNSHALCFLFLDSDIKHTQPNPPPHRLLNRNEGSSRPAAPSAAAADLSSFELAVNLHRVGYTDAYRLARLCTHEPPGNSSPTSFLCPRFAFPQVCSDLSQGRIAIIAIGISPSFRLISAIAANLVSPFPQRPLQTLLGKSSSFFSQNVPYLTVSHDLDYSSPAGPPSASAYSSPASQKYQLLHMHPPVSKLMSSLVDLVEYYKWE